MSKQDTLETIREVPDALWEEIEPLIRELDPPKPTGRKRHNPGKMLNALIFRMRSSCRWNQLPGCLGDDGTVHRTLSSAGWPPAYSPVSGLPSSRAVKSWVAWTGNGGPPTPRWARPVWGDAVGRNPTDRGKPGTKRSLVVEADGGSPGHRDGRGERP